MDARQGFASSFALFAALTATLTVLVALTGCQSTAPATQPQPHNVSPSTDDSAEQSARMAALQPIDIAVAPLRNTSGDARVPGEVLRKRVVAGLVEKLYSPLDTRYFDSRAQEAGFSARELGAQAVLQISITRYDSALLRLQGAVKVSGDAFLLDGADPAAEPLWSMSFDRRLELGPVSTLPADDAPLYARAAEQMAALILAEFPARKPVLAAAP